MTDKTKIEWTDATWNPIRGCSRVSEGCRHCYAETVANRFKGPGQPYEGLIARSGQWNGQIKLVQELLDKPLRWRKPRRIFVNSMSDLFHEEVPDTYIDKVFAVMAMAHWHTFQVLTKRPERMLRYFQEMRSSESRGFNVCSYFGASMEDCERIGRTPAGLPNVWLGVSVEDQKTADERIPLLLQTPAAVLWISAEPLLGHIDLHKCQATYADYNHESAWNAGNVDWVVVGGESGPGARPMHPEWARRLRDQCVSAGVPFFFKQWGEWRQPLDGEKYNTSMGRAQRVPAFIVSPRGSVHCFENEETRSGGEAMLRVGKKQAGRLLDGREWNEYPE